MFGGFGIAEGAKCRVEQLALAATAQCQANGKLSAFTGTTFICPTRLLLPHLTHIRPRHAEQYGGTDQRRDRDQKNQNQPETHTEPHRICSAHRPVTCDGCRLLRPELRSRESNIAIYPTHEIMISDGQSDVCSITPTANVKRYVSGCAEENPRFSCAVS